MELLSFTFDNVVFENNVGTYIEGENSMQPKLLELSSEHFVIGELQEITISGMELRANSFRSVDSPFEFKDLYRVTLSSV